MMCELLCFRCRFAPTRDTEEEKKLREGLARVEACRVLSEAFEFRTLETYLSECSAVGRRSDDVGLSTQIAQVPNCGSQLRKLLATLISEFSEPPTDSEKVFALVTTTIEIYNRHRPAFGGDYAALRQVGLGVRVSVATILYMATIALELPSLFPVSIPLLPRGKSDEVWLSASQAAAILANGFFCTFDSGRRKGDYPEINFFALFHGGGHGSVELRAEKLLCILHYFERRRKEKEKAGGARELMLSFQRKCLHPGGVSWPRSSVPLGVLHAMAEGSIESGVGCLQVDFANRNVGGGVLCDGSVQEEIRFATCPELIAARLLAEALGDSETLVVTGAQRFCAYSGYGRTFKFEGDYVDDAPEDKFGRKVVQLVAMDARLFSSGQVWTQFGKEAVKRELNKAFCAFREETSRLGSGRKLPPIASGNWGCGAFNGDPELKALLQLMAASVAGRSLLFFTFGDAEQAEALSEVHATLRRKELSVAGLFRLIVQYSSKNFGSVRGRERKGKSLYAFLMDRLRD